MLPHVTIAHEDDQSKAHQKSNLYFRSGDPSPDHTENILEFERIATNVAIAHATIVHDDDQISQKLRLLSPPLL